MFTQTPFIMNPFPESAPAVPFTEVTIPSDTGETRRVHEAIETLLRARDTSEQEMFSVRLALDEALVNAIKHGNQMDRTKCVYVGYRLLGDRLDIRITDEGPGFDPDDVPDPTAIENLERPCGRGLMLMRHYMNEVDYHGSGNTVCMSKVFRK